MILVFDEVFPLVLSRWLIVVEGLIIVFFSCEPICVMLARVIGFALFGLVPAHGFVCGSQAR